MPELQSVETPEPQDTVINLDTLDDAALEEQIALGDGEPSEVPEEENAAAQEPEGEHAPEETPVGEQVQPEGTPKELQPEENTTPAAETDVKKLQKRLDDSQAFIQQQAKEIGELRKPSQVPLPQNAQQGLQLTPEEEEQVNDLYLENPVKAWALNTELLQQKQQAMAKYQSEQEARILAENKEFVDKSVPDLSESLDDMATILRSEGVSEENISNFRSNPYWVNAGELINLAKRAKEEKRNAVLEKENAELRQKLGDFPKKIKDATKSTKLNGNIASAPKGEKAKIEEAQLTKISDADLEKLIEDNSD
jgi:hypothetical protein